MSVLRCILCLFLFLRVALVVVICVMGFKLEEELVLVERGVNVSTFSSVAIFVNRPVPPH